MKENKLLDIVRKYYAEKLFHEKARVLYPKAEDLNTTDRLTICNFLTGTGSDISTLANCLNISDMPADVKLLEYILSIYNKPYDKASYLFNISERQFCTFINCLDNIYYQNLNGAVHELKDFIYNYRSNIDMPISTVEKEFINIMLKGIQGDANVIFYITRDLREALYQTIKGDDKLDLCNKIGCNVEELESFINGRNPNFSEEKLKLLCMLLSLSNNSFRPGYFRLEN